MQHLKLIGVHATYFFATTVKYHEYMVFYNSNDNKWIVFHSKTDEIVYQFIEVRKRQFVNQTRAKQILQRYLVTVKFQKRKP